MRDSREGKVPKNRVAEGTMKRVRERYAGEDGALQHLIAFVNDATMQAVGVPCPAASGPSGMPLWLASVSHVALRRRACRSDA